MAQPPHESTTAQPSDASPSDAPPYGSAVGGHRRVPGLSRRGLIGAVGAAAAATAAAPAVVAAAGRDHGSPATEAPTEQAARGTVERAFPETRSGEPAAGTVAALAFPAGWVAARWDGPDEGGRVRFSTPEGDSDWAPVPATCSSANGGARLIAADGATGYRVQPPTGARNLRTRALDTTGGPRRRARVPEEHPRLRSISYLSRAEWGADESKRFRTDGTEIMPPAFYPLQTITVHHTDTANNAADPAAVVRAIYDFHAVDNGWGDIGYQFLVDEAGRIYEGRWSGGSGMPGHDARGNMVTAAHVGGANSGNLGIALLGNLTGRPPTEAAQTAVTELCAALARLHGLDPLARIRFVNPVDGSTREVQSISGHCDWMATECPGAVMYGELAALRTRVAAARR
ncbi:peptidoglycan recognition protein family protein [Streptomyces bohaiensis]|uniref:N-acetylmuramoyl-L-alanine amidase n=1 Tax=Streptomyces bohaiensis TaxID=1431344 RepID=A0ABX1C3D0_9ACTN|nr:peptidoglycan recognition family protein [Streptomyces bohaiensis]NJQ13731.1 N-acetylmuramoyl-L-alanine amidase [Streptomyces bohaiensis]